MKRRYQIMIRFQANEDGKNYELASIKLRTKPMTLKRANELAVAQAKKCWTHYEIELLRLP